MPLPLRVLIVEDSPDDAELMVLHLTNEEFQPEWQHVQTEQAYLDALETNPDLILADWNLPQFSGHRALVLMNERGLDFPFIIVSGSIGEEAAVDALRQGAYDYVLKDRPTRLGQAVRRALEDKRLRENRKRAEETLRESEERYRTVADYTYDWEYWRAVDGKILYMSPSCERITGYHVKEFVENPDLLDTIVHPDDQFLFEQHRTFVQQDEREHQVHETDFRILRKNGEVRWMGHICQAVRRADGTGLGRRVGNRDITERKRMERAIYLMSETQRQIARLDDLTGIYQLVGQKIQELIGDSYVAITMLDEQTQALKVVGVYGFGSLYETLVQTFKMDPSKTVYPVKDMSDDELRLFRSGRLEAFEGGLYHLLVRKLPKRICSTVERELSLTGIYTMGFVWQDIHFGGLTLLAKCDIAPYKDMIETIMNQAAIAIRRIRSETTLRDSEARYRSLIENQSEVIARSDIDGHLSVVNDAFCQAFGQSREELLGQVFTPTVFPEDVPVSLSALKAIQSPPHRIQTETRHLTPQGLRWFEWENSAVLDKNGKVIELQGVGRDITERKQAEEQLRQSEAALKKAQQVSHVGSWVWHTQKNRLEWSDEMYRIFGIEKESFTGTLTDVIASAIHPDDRAAVEQSNLSVIKDKKPVALEYRVIRPDGTVRVVWAEAGELTLDEAGKPTILTGIVQDITERKQTEEALQKSEALLHSLVESLPQNVFSKDLQGRFTFANKQYGAIEGKPLETILGKTDFDLHPPELAAKYQSDDRRVMETGQILDIVEEHQPLGRDKFYVQVIKAPLYDGKGNVVGILGIFWDITERKRAEEALRVSEERFRKLFELSPDAIMLIDPHAADVSWPIISCNESACQMNGYSRSDLIGRSIDILHEEAADRAERDAYLERLRSAGTFKGETLHRRQDGTLFPVMYSTSLIALGDRELVLGIDRDITERKRAEESLRESEAQLSNAMKIARLGYWEYDVASDQFTFNDHFYAIFRTTAEREGGYQMSPARYAERFVHPDDALIVGTENRMALETTDPHYSRQLEHRILYADGETGYITVRFFVVKDDRGRTVKTYGANQDITERKQAEDKIRQQLAELQRWYDLTLDRETRALELKHEVNELLRRLNAPPRYRSSEEDL